MFSAPGLGVALAGSTLSVRTVPVVEVAGSIATAAVRGAESAALAGAGCEARRMSLGITTVTSTMAAATASRRTRRFDREGRSARDVSASADGRAAAVTTSALVPVVAAVVAAAGITVSASDQVRWLPESSATWALTIAPRDDSRNALSAFRISAADW